MTWKGTTMGLGAWNMGIVTAGVDPALVPAEPKPPVAAVHDYAAIAAELRKIESRVVAPPPIADAATLDAAPMVCAACGDSGWLPHVLLRGYQLCWCCGNPQNLPAP